MPRVLTLAVDRMDTPIGELLLLADEAGSLRALDWIDYEDRMRRLLRVHYGPEGFDLTRQQTPHALREALTRYFSGDLRAITNLKLSTGGTSFQRVVWNELCNIAGGTVISYRQLANRIGRPTAVRAVGLANGANPIGIVVPCHRVIGADGSLTGYGGGLERKRWLLEHERKHAHG
jgi:methylated-DNA-[protein]-cysteine S-methyltransferase